MDKKFDKNYITKFLVELTDQKCQKLGIEWPKDCRTPESADLIKEFSLAADKIARALADLNLAIRVYSKQTKETNS